MKLILSNPLNGSNLVVTSQLYPVSDSDSYPEYKRLRAYTYSTVVVVNSYPGRRYVTPYSEMMLALNNFKKNEVFFVPGINYIRQYLQTFPYQGSTDIPPVMDTRFISHLHKDALIAKFMDAILINSADSQKPAQSSLKNIISWLNEEEYRLLYPYLLPEECDTVIELNHNDSNSALPLVYASKKVKYMRLQLSLIQPSIYFSRAHTEVKRLSILSKMGLLGSKGYLIHTLDNVFTANPWTAIFIDFVNYFLGSQIALTRGIYSYDKTLGFVYSQDIAS